MLLPSETVLQLCRVQQLLSVSSMQLPEFLQQMIWNISQDNEHKRFMTADTVGEGIMFLPVHPPCLFPIRPIWAPGW